MSGGGAAEGREVASGRRARLAESPGGHVAQPYVSSVVVALAGDDQRVEQLVVVYSIFQALLSTLLSGSIRAWLSYEARPLNYDKVLGLLQPAGLLAIAGHWAGRAHEDECLVNIFDPRLVNLWPTRALGRHVENPVTDHGFDAAPISHVFSSCFPIAGALGAPAGAGPDEPGIGLPLPIG